MSAREQQVSRNCKAPLSRVEAGRAPEEEPWGRASEGENSWEIERRGC